jgi:homoserine dehydrogenase
VGLLGYGRVGQAVAAGILQSRGRLEAAGVSLTCIGALVRQPARLRGGPPMPCTTEPAQVISRADLLVEVLGGIEPACALAGAALDAGTPVVTANKTLVAHHGAELRALAAARGTTFACDAAVLAGVPFLGSLARRPLVSASRRILGIVNGTSHVVAGALDEGASFDEALRLAIDAGYAEADSEADVSGRDAAEKLTVLLHLAGQHGAAPGRLTAGRLDALDQEDFRDARRAGGVIKPVVLASLEPGASGAWVGPALVVFDHPFARLGGVDNVLTLTDSHGHVVTFGGPGAGPAATAQTIIDDVVEAAVRGRGAPRRPIGSVGANGTPRVPLDEPPPGPWFLRVDDGGRALTVRRFAEHLAAAGVGPVHLTARRRRLVARTAPAPWRAVCRALESCGAGRSALVLPIIEHQSHASKETHR